MRDACVISLERTTTTLMNRSDTCSALLLSRSFYATQGLRWQDDTPSGRPSGLQLGNLHVRAGYSSPRLPSSMVASILRMILPEGVIGTASTN